MKNVLYPACNTLIAGICLVGLPASAQLDQAIQEGERATRQAEQIQNQINQLDDERSDAVREYRSMLQRKTGAELFALQQQKVVESQRTELESLNEQLGRVDEITAQMTPMMMTMIEDLKTFVAADLPFKKEDRELRLEQLDTAMEAPDVAPAERYRLIVEAYQAEMEYGRTIDSWAGDITNAAGETVNVQFFQYGRVALVYYNAANGEVARWDREGSAWETLPSSYRRPIQDAIRIAEGTKQQDILMGPVEKYSVE
ncbi:MAG: hypothetical protein CMK09_07040 [Ponticaulis sp.]|nr:hypothetical protein [Ponticaulis sp.]|tara:strand:- start:47896 stop:48666 length:771 start_codon:yes stop_codon:yes gene_type:complete